MNRSLLWRGVLILVILGVAVALAVPPKEKINLGLDLQGGMHLVLQVKTQDALRAEVESGMDTLRRVAEDEEDITGFQTRRLSDTAFEVTGLPEASRDRLSGVVQRFLPDFARSKDSSALIYELTPQATGEIRRLSVKQAVETIRNRIDAFGVAEPVIQEASDYRILIQLPGVDDPERVRRLIKNTALLEFRLVRFPQGGGGAPTREAILANFGGRLPEELEILEGDIRDNNDRTRILGEQYYAVEKRRVITGRDLKTARPSQGQFGEPIVTFSLNPAGAQVFGEVTGSNIGTGLAIILDNRVVSAPRINARITNEGLIEGGFTQQEAEDLSTVLRSGALPASLTTLEERTVGPSLGRDSVEQGLKAGIIGTILVVIYILSVYWLTGFNAVLALIMNLVLLFGGLAAFDATLTLPGIAGIILTIGMAVDANVLVFERIREELAAGRSVRSAVDLGFERALSSILDSNITTLIAALFLFQFGTGPIRGFAVTLSIGLIASIFTAVFVSRWMFHLVLSRRGTHRLRMPKQFLPPTNIDFMRYRKFWIVVSLALVVGGIFAIFVHGNLNVGVDFAGGTQMTLRFRERPDTEQLRSLLSSAGVEDPTIQRFGEEENNEVIVRTRLVEGAEEGSREQVVAALNRRYNRGQAAGRPDLNRIGAETVTSLLLQADPDRVLPAGAAAADPAAAERARAHYDGMAEALLDVRREQGMFTSQQEVAAAPGVSPAAAAALSRQAYLGDYAIVAVENVGPQIGGELRKQGFWAVALSLLGMLAYIWIRFELRFGIGAIMACVHDVLVTLGLFALVGFEFNLTTVAAFLTLIGYSVNDSVVIFDRIRENMRKSRRRPLIEVMNESINQTLSRTLLTGGSTLLALIALLIWGGDVIRGFAFVMTVGIIVGTYSSIYVASPFALLWEQMFAGRQKPGDRRTGRAEEARSAASTPTPKPPARPEPRAASGPRSRAAGRR
jgi:protein-export membrane protein SecD/preprotein translocase SecF subunit